MKSNIYILIILVFISLGLASASIWGEMADYGVKSTVNLTSPVNFYNSSISLIQLNISVNVVGSTLKNISIFTNSSGVFRINQSLNTNNISMWNSTGYLEAHGNPFNAGSGTDTNYHGAVIYPNREILVTNITISSGSTASTCRIGTTWGGNEICSGTVDGVSKNCLVNCILSASTTYYVSVDSGLTRYYSLGGTPVSGTYLTWLTGFSGNTNYSNIRDIQSLDISINKINATNASVSFYINEFKNTLWGAQACDNQDVCGMSINQTILLNNIAPSINISYPTNNIPLAFLGQNISLNYTVSSNAQTCWFNYNYTNYTLSCNTNGSFILTDQKKLVLFANDSLGNTANNTIDWDYNIFYFTNYTNMTYETGLNNFNLNASYNSSLYSTFNVFLNYNNINYLATKLGTGDSLIFSNSIPIPLNQNDTQNNSLYWNLYLINNSGYELNYTTEPVLQEVRSIYLAFCNSTYKQQAVNFTTKDEKNSTYLLSSFQATWQYWTGNGAVKKNYSYSDLTFTNKSYAFCISQNTTYYVNSQIGYSASGYIDRTYIINNGSLTNQTTPISLLLLANTYAQKFTIKALQPIASPIANALIYINKQNLGTGGYDNVGIRQTDADGQTIEYLEIDKLYQFTVINSNGLVLGTIQKNAVCATSPCEIDLNVGEFNSAGLFDWYNSNVANSVTYAWNWNQSSKILSLGFVDTSGLAKYVRVQVNKGYLNNSVTSSICNNFYYGVSGTITCNLSAYDNGDFIANAYISRSPEKLIDTFNFVISSVAQGLGLIAIWLSIAWIITLTFASAAISRGNPSTILFVGVIIGVTSAKLIGFFPFSWGIVMTIDLLTLWIVSKVET